MNGHSEFKVQMFAALRLVDIVKQLDTLYNGKGHFYLVDSGPYQGHEGYTTFLIAGWIPGKGASKQ